MSEPAEQAHASRSIFAKLLVIMLSLAVGLLLIVGVFFWLIVNPNLANSMEPLIEDYARQVAARSPNLEEAKRLRSQVHLVMRYEGPDGVSWSTAGDLPSIESARQRPAAMLGPVALHGPGHTNHVVTAPNGGTYLFTWTFGRGMESAHLILLFSLLGLMCGIVFIAHAVLKNLLLPLRTLGDGVARLSEGQLDIELVKRRPDELGVLTDAFNQMVRRVRQMIQARDQLLLDVSHELRSPLTRLKVALALLPENDKTARMAGDMAEMEHMILELLELERLRDGRGIRFARNDLSRILQEVVSAFQDRAPGVDLIAAPREIPLDIDANGTRTVLSNLLENAVKYSLPDSRAVEVSIAQDDTSVVVRISDDGVGIPEGDLERLFDPFFRVDPSRSKKTGGYGLGLSICKRIIEAHGGEIHAERNAGRGASFVVTLPKRD
jgi:signal transduction histidine kinase